MQFNLGYMQSVKRQIKDKEILWVCVSCVRMYVLVKEKGRGIWAEHMHLDHSQPTPNYPSIKTWLLTDTNDDHIHLFIKADDRTRKEITSSENEQANERTHQMMERKIDWKTEWANNLYKAKKIWMKKKKHPFLHQYL